MLSDAMVQKLNDQINAEYYSWYAYMAMSAYCQSISMNGFANWFYLQAEEERAHAEKIYKYVIDRDALVTLQPIGQPQTEFESLTEVLTLSLEHEKHITSLLNDIASEAIKSNDHATAVFMHWFITEQIEEEATARDNLDALKLAGDSGEGLLLLDREFAARKPEDGEGE